MFQSIQPDLPITELQHICNLEAYTQYIGRMLPKVLYETKKNE